MEWAVTQYKDEVDKMFFDVLDRKEKADKTRNALLVLNRFKYQFRSSCRPTSAPTSSRKTTIVCHRSTSECGPCTATVVPDITG